MFIFSGFDELPVDSKDISMHTWRDPVFGLSVLNFHCRARVLEYTLVGWPNHVTEEELKLSCKRQNELTADQGCVLWEMRVIILP